MGAAWNRMRLYHGEGGSNLRIQFGIRRMIHSEKEDSIVISIEDREPERAAVLPTPTSKNYASSPKPWM